MDRETRAGRAGERREPKGEVPIGVSELERERER